MAGSMDPFDAEVVPVDVDDPTGQGLVELLSRMTAADGTPYLDILMDVEGEAE